MKMNKPIYFTRIEYREYLASNTLLSIILLNLVDKELSYQRYVKKQPMPAIQGIESIEICDNRYVVDMKKPARVMRNEHTDFKSVLLPEEEIQYEIAFSYGIKLSDKDMQDLLPYCNALDFESYRNREMTMDDAGYETYRDEVRLEFCGVTDTYIPMIKLPMQYVYDEEHTWPSEKLYQYIIKKYFANNKKFRIKSRV